MNSIQLTHNQVRNNNNNKEIIVITDTIRTPENVGMIFRVSEAFGVKKVILLGDSPKLSNKKVLRTARSTEKNLQIEYVDEIQLVVDDLIKNNFQLIGLELTNSSIGINQFTVSSINKIAIFIGAERFGIDEKILKQLEKIVHIDLFGKNSSINVVNALAIALFELTK